MAIQIKGKIVGYAVASNEEPQEKQQVPVAVETVPNRPVTVVGSGLMSTAGLVEIMMTAER